MRLRFKTILSFIIILLISILLVGAGYVYYKEHIKKEALIIANGDLTINYVNGDKFSNNKNKKLSFSVTNDSDKVRYYYILIKNIKGNNKKVSYELKSQKKDILLKGKLKSEIIYNSIAINPKMTDNYTITFTTNNNESYGGEVAVESKLKDEMTFSDVILQNNKVNEATISKIGEISTEDEGLQKSSDTFGPTYYFRGNVQDNYVSFGNMTWRIVKINGDGSVKLVLNDILDVLGKYYEGSSYDYNSSQIKKELKKWYDTRLDTYSDLIANYKFCNDNVQDDKTGNYIAYNRINVDLIPNFVCFGEKINTKIGLLTADEVMLAGGGEKENTNYYLYNDKIENEYYTMTSAKYANDIYYPYMVSKSGNIISNIAGNLNRGIRPVINIVHSVTAVGKGTINDPYIIEGLIQK